MNKIEAEKFYRLDLNYPVWSRFFMVHPLVIIGTLDKDNSINLAPKHMVTPMGWSNYFGFICTPNHTTYKNIIREGKFTVSYPKPGQVLETSLSASPRQADDVKPELKQMKVLTTEAGLPVLDSSYVFLECSIYKIYDDFEVNSLITGKIESCFVDHDFLLNSGRDEKDIIAENPIMAYLNPGRFSVISDNQHFPYPKGFKK